MLGLNRTWCGDYLSKEGADLFKEYLRKHDILFEPSEAFNLIHFECLMTEDELNMANNWIAEGNLK